MQRVQPADEFGGRRWLFANVECALAQLVEEVDRGAGTGQLAIEVGAHDLAHRLLVGKGDVVEHATAQESIGQVLLAVAGEHDDRRVVGIGFDGAHLEFRNAEVLALDLVEEVVREIARRLVDLVDQDDTTARLAVVGQQITDFLRRARTQDRLAERVEAEILPVVAAHRRIVGGVEAAQVVEVVEQVARRTGRFGLELEQRQLALAGLHSQRARQVAGVGRLAGTRLAGEQQRLLELDRHLGGDRSGSAEGRAADRPLQPVVRPCVCGQPAPSRNASSG
jgi:hypothetical protein